MHTATEQILERASRQDEQRRKTRARIFAEREACAQLVESFTDIADRWRIARAIRMRGDPGHE